MLSDTISLGTVVVSFVRRAYSGLKSQFVPTGDTPANERKLTVGHEKLKSGGVKTLFGVSHVILDPGSPVGATQVITVNLTISRPKFATATQVKLAVDQAVTGLTPAMVDKLFNQEL